MQAGKGIQGRHGHRLAPGCPPPPLILAHRRLSHSLLAAAHLACYSLAYLTLGPGLTAGSALPWFPETVLASLIASALASAAFHLIRHFAGARTLVLVRLVFLAILSLTLPGTQGPTLFLALAAAREIALVFPLPEAAFYLAALLALPSLLLSGNGGFAVNTFQGVAAPLSAFAPPSAFAFPGAADIAFYLGVTGLHSLGMLVAGTQLRRTGELREVHDISGYTFTNLLALMDAAMSRPADQRTKLQETLLTARKQAQEGLQETRLALRKMREAPVDGVQGLTNAIRHGKATHIHLQFWIRGDTLVISIPDNGRGSAAITKGIGLQGMEERLRDLGGRLEAGNALAGGFMLVIHIPLKGAQP